MQGRIIKERYRLLDQLGQGGMGSVWRAEDLNLHIDVAVKLIDPNYANSAEAQARFQREALAAAQLRSMHIVLITDHGVDADTPYIVMELLRGQSLAARLHERSVLGFDETLSVFSQIAEALAFAHERKIVHRDLKPDNVFIVSERTRELVKVLDFGVAKKLDAQSFGNKLKTHTGTLLGTPYYMSPEQTRGSAGVDHRADIWSFGVMVYECITGKRPFEADTLPDLLMAICRDPFVPASEVAPVPAGFDEWFAQATARDVSERFQSIEAAANALGSLNSAKLVGSRQRASEASARVATLRIRPNAEPTSGDEPAVSPAVAPSANSFVPSSVTSPAIAKTGSRRTKLGWLLAALAAATSLLGYWLWPSHPGGTAREPAASAQHEEAVDVTTDTMGAKITAPSVAAPTLTGAVEVSAPALASAEATPSSSVAAAPSVLPALAATTATSSATVAPSRMKPMSNAVDAAPSATPLASSKPKDRAAARPPGSAATGPRPTPSSTKRFAGGF